MKLKVFLWNILDNFRFYRKYSRMKKKKNIFLLDTPIHENIGDSAIAYAELIFLKNILLDEFEIIELNQKLCKKYRSIIKCLIGKNDVVLLHGGGNMGIEWFEEEESRRYWISNLKKNKVIIFPQTIFYPDTVEGKAELLRSKEIYNKHSNLTIIGREEKSFKIMKDNYVNANILLTPDIVLYLKDKIKLKKTNQNESCILCFRNDAEKNIDNKIYNRIEVQLNQLNIPFSYTDMISSGIIEDNREKIIFDKLNMFNDAKLVITDRLHAMVFCYLTNTPCLVFENYNHKVKGTYEWIKSSKYIKLINENCNLNDEIREVLDYKNDDVNLDYMNLFDKIKNSIYKK